MDERRTGRQRGLIICLILAVWASALAADSTGPQTGSSRVSITTTKLEVTDRNLEWRYRITNGSEQDIWICESMNAGEAWSLEVHLDKDMETLLIQRRLDLPMEGSGEQPLGRYVRLRPGQTRDELMSLPLPVSPQRVLSGGRVFNKLADATRLALQIGFHFGDLPSRLLDLIDRAEKVSGTKTEDMPIPAYRTGMTGWFGGTLSFTRLNENILDRDEQVLIPWSDQTFRGEDVVRITIEGLHIPYQEGFREPMLPDLTTCDRVAMRFLPSALQFFYPHENQQSLLGMVERDFLTSQRQVVVSDRHRIEAIAGEVAGGLGGVFVAERAIAQITCQRGDKYTTSLTVYEDTSVVTAEGQVVRYPKGLPSLRMCLPEMSAIDLRLRCADNLRDLWYRLRLYRVAKYAPVDLTEWWDRYHSQGGRTAYPSNLTGEEATVYPASAHWCDDLLRGYRATGPEGPEDSVLRPYNCISAGGGRCHYAMNPDCGPESAGNVVLLFETKAGWNQHGGPELFTFDNHDPKGGCVLLNDGTVKFIRTEEELHALRWK